MKCFKCKQVGHISSDCKNPKKTQVGSNQSKPNNLQFLQSASFAQPNAQQKIVIGQNTDYNSEKKQEIATPKTNNQMQPSYSYQNPNFQKKIVNIMPTKIVSTQTNQSKFIPPKQSINKNIQNIQNSNNNNPPNQNPQQNNFMNPNRTNNTIQTNTSQQFDQNSNNTNQTNKMNNSTTITNNTNFNQNQSPTKINLSSTPLSQINSQNQSVGSIKTNLTPTIIPNNFTKQNNPSQSKNLSKSPQQITPPRNPKMLLQTSPIKNSISQQNSNFNPSNSLNSNQISNSSSQSPNQSKTFNTNQNQNNNFSQPKIPFSHPNSLNNTQADEIKTNGPIRGVFVEITLNEIDQFSVGQCRSTQLLEVYKQFKNFHYDPITKEYSFDFCHYDLFVKTMKKIQVNLKELPKSLVNLCKQKSIPLSHKESKIFFF